MLDVLIEVAVRSEDQYGILIRFLFVAFKRAQEGIEFGISTVSFPLFSIVKQTYRPSANPGKSFAFFPVNTSFLQAIRMQPDLKNIKFAYPTVMITVY